MHDSRFEITDHAIMRYVERHAPESTYWQARASLEELLAEATPLKTKTFSGEALWRVGEPPVLFVMKPDGGKHVLVTVLPPGANESEERDLTEAEEVIAAYRRIQPLLEREKSQKSAAEVEHARLNRAKALFAENNNLRQKLASAEKKLETLSTGGDRNELRQKLASAEQKRSAAAVLVNDLQQKLSSLTVRLARQVQHAERMSRDKSESRRALMVALRALYQLLGEDNAVFVAIKNIQPQFVERSFWDR